MIELRGMNPLSLAVDWLIEQTGKTKLTLEDLVERCRLGQIELIAMIPKWKDGGVGEVKWMRRLAIADPKAQADGILLDNGKVHVNDGHLVPISEMLSGNGWIFVSSEMASRLLDTGESSLSCARMISPDPSSLDEPWIGTHDGRMVNFSHLRVKKSALEAFAARQEYAGTDGTSGAADLLTVAPQRQRVTGVNRNVILAAFPAPRGRTEENWKKTLGDPPGWLVSARISNGKPSVSALWNPARFAMALFEKRLTLGDQKYMTLENLTDIMRREFTGWLQEWEEYTASF